MSEKGPFDAAIRGLEMDLAILREGKGTKDRDLAVREYEAAIQVLEAAGRVEKRGALITFDDPASILNCQEEQGTKDCIVCTILIDDCYVKQIRALLEALPDGEGEKI